MPNRIIRESLLKSDTYSVLTPSERDLFIRLIVIADDHGRFDAGRKTIRPSCFPIETEEGTVRTAQVEEWLAWIERTGAVALYEIDGKRYGILVNWSDHQRDRDSKPKHPDPPEEAIRDAKEREESLSTYLRQPAATCREWRRTAAGCGDSRPSSRRYGAVGMEPQLGVVSRVQTTTISPGQVVFTAKGFVIPDGLEEQWQEAQPDLVIAEEIKRAHAWAVANPRKHKGNWHRFLVNWFARAHDRAPRNGTPPARAAPTLEHRAAGITAAVKRMREEGKIP